MAERLIKRRERVEEFDRLCESGDYFKVIEWLQKRYRENGLNHLLWATYGQALLGVETWEGVTAEEFSAAGAAGSAKACAYGFMAEFSHYKGKIDEALHYVSVRLEEAPSDLFLLKQASSIMLSAKSIVHRDEIELDTNQSPAKILADIGILIEEFDKMAVDSDAESDDP